MQSTVDHLATIVLTKTATRACIDHFQTADVDTPGACDELLVIGSGVGFASNDQGVARLSKIFKAMAALSETGKIVTSDVSGMDWSLGGSVLLATYKMRVDAIKNSVSAAPLTPFEKEVLCATEIAPTIDEPDSFSGNRQCRRRGTQPTIRPM